MFLWRQIALAPGKLRSPHTLWYGRWIYPGSCWTQQSQKWPERPQSLCTQRLNSWTSSQPTSGMSTPRQQINRYQLRRRASSPAANIFLFYTWSSRAKYYGALWAGCSGELRTMCTSDYCKLLFCNFFCRTITDSFVLLWNIIQPLFLLLSAASYQVGDGRIFSSVLLLVYFVTSVWVEKKYNSWK